MLVIRPPQRCAKIGVESEEMGGMEISDEDLARSIA
jgi:hypothetical protein